jgi:probable HAF family extracellular repeat protein
MQIRSTLAACAGFLLIGSLLAAPAQAAGNPGARAKRAVVLPMLSGGAGFAHAINNNGDIVGSSKLASGNYHAVLWSGGRVKDLGTLGGRNSDAWDIDADGRIVGSSQDAAGNSHAVMWFGGTITDLGLLDGLGADARGISNGVIVGTRYAFDSFNGRRAFVIRNGTAIDIAVPPGATADGVNDSGAVVGTYGFYDYGQPEFPFHQAYVWRDGVATTLGTFGGPGSTGTAINTPGHAVGLADDANGLPRPFFWDGTTLNTLSSPSTETLSPTSINRYDVVAGTNGTTNRAIVWSTPKAAPQPLPLPSGSVGTHAADINDSGTVVGYAT